MLKIDRSAVDTAIENLEGMFSNTEKVLSDYEAEKADLVKRGNDLSDRLNELQQLYTATLIQREEETNTAIYIKLSKQLNEAEEERKIIVSLQEQLKEDFQRLKQKYVPVIRGAYNKDSRAMSAFDVNYEVDNVLYELIKAISDVAKAVRKEDSKVIGIVQDEFLSDSALMYENRGFQRTFDFDRTNLSYYNDTRNLLTKNNINLACGGGIDSEFRKPKEVK